MKTNFNLSEWVDAMIFEQLDNTSAEITQQMISSSATFRSSLRHIHLVLPGYIITK
jgi:hypothetical protein